MPRHPVRTLGPLVILLALAATATATVQAQTNADPQPTADSSTRAPEIVVLEHDGWQMELPGDQPLVVYIRETTDNLDGSWVLYTPFARDAGGAFTPLTPCDDVSVTCLPIRTRAGQALAGANVGDTLILAELD